MSSPGRQIFGLTKVVSALVLGLALLALPDSARHPVSLSLVRVDGAEAVDLDDGLVWILALGSDARPGEDITEGRADAIELVGLDLDNGNAVAVGVPRDAWIDIPGHGFDRINATLHLGGPSLVAESVERLVGITPTYVLTTGFGGFESMVDSIGILTVRSEHTFEDPDLGVSVHRGLNRMDGTQALAFSRSRDVPGSDFDRQANHQELMKAVLRKLRAGDDDPGLLEGGALAALEAFAAVGTDLSPLDLYKLAQAISTLEVRQVTTCVLPATPDEVGEASVVRVDEGQARRVGDDVSEDARLDGPCAG